jgi:hypothetical protein
MYIIKRDRNSITLKSLIINKERAHKKVHLKVLIENQEIKNRRNQI